MAEKGRDPLFGARPLKRALQKYVLDPLAMKIIEGEFLSREYLKVEFDSKKDCLSFVSQTS